MPDLFDYEVVDPAQERWWELYRPTDILCSVCGRPATAIFAGYGVEWRGIAACSPAHERAAEPLPSHVAEQIVRILNRE